MSNNSPLPGVHDPRAYARARARTRASNRERIHNRVVHPIDVPRLLRDPLVRYTSPLRSTVAVTRLVILAVIAHGLTILFFAVLGAALGNDRFQPKNERVQFEIHDAPDARSPLMTAAMDDGAPSAPPPSPPEPVPVETPPPPPPDPPRPRKPRRTRRPAQTPTQTQTSVDEPAPPESESPAAPPRKIGGLGKGSTAKRADGPAFPTGDPSGSPEGTSPVHGPDAAAHRSDRSAAGSAPHGEDSNQRPATRIPTRDKVFLKPKRLTPSKPTYPPSLRAQGIEGEVQVRVLIGPAGDVRRVDIARSSGHAAFDNTAKKAALAEKFSPAKRDGEAVETSISYTYHFRIDD
ncbi:MAG: energy transducer TonB [Nannocystales bacterium]